MDALIKVKVSELNGVFLERIKAFFKGKDDAELTISFDGEVYDYHQMLNRSISELEQKEQLVTFTMDELEAYTANKKQA